MGDALQAVTEKLACWPGINRARAGLVIRMGAPGAGVTVNIARLLVVLPVVLRLGGHSAWHQPKWLGRILPKVRFSH